MRSSSPRAVPSERRSSEPVQRVPIRILGAEDLDPSALHSRRADNAGNVASKYLVLLGLGQEVPSGVSAADQRARKSSLTNITVAQAKPKRTCQALEEGTQ